MLIKLSPITKYWPLFKTIHLKKLSINLEMSSLYYKSPCLPVINQTETKMCKMNGTNGKNIEEQICPEALAPSLINPIASWMRCRNATKIRRAIPKRIPEMITKASHVPFNSRTPGFSKSSD